MKTRRQFLQTTGLLSASLLLQQNQVFSFPEKEFESKRPPLSERKFTSASVEDTIRQLKKKIINPELAWMFENCFPNTLDTTVDFELISGKPDTYVITGDIDAMWLRDSTAQVWPYIPLIKNDAPLRELIKGVINRQTNCILLDPYANAFYKDVHKISEWKSDHTKMLPGIHERKWEIDSLCYPIRLAYGYWKVTGDASVFDHKWKEAMRLVLQTFKEQQRFHSKGPYSFQRTTSWATDGVPLGGYGYPVKPNGLICSVFRPSDDSTIYPYFIPGNLFAIQALGQLAVLFSLPEINDLNMANEATALQQQVKLAFQQNGIINHSRFGKVIAFEINGYGSFNLMDDGNVPSLLSLPYIGAVAANDPLYINTRKFILSDNNPFYFKGNAAEGVGSPHTGIDSIWPMGIIMRGITSTDEKEQKKCLDMLLKTHAATGFMHESFHKDNAKLFTRKWFAWANTLFGEFVLKINREHPSLLTS